METTERFIASKDVFDLICKGQYLKEWYTAIDYNRLFMKAVTVNAIFLRYIVRSREIHIADTSSTYRCFTIKPDDLKVGAVPQLINSILFKKRITYNLDEIKVFRSLSDKTQELYAEHEGQFIDLSVLKKTLELLLKPIFVDINLRVKYLKAYNQSNYRYKLREDFIHGVYITDMLQKPAFRNFPPVILANIMFKLEYAIYWCFQQAVSVSELSHEGKLELITRLTLFYPYLPQIIQILTTNPQSVTFDSFLSRIAVRKFDYGIATFLYETLTTNKNNDKDAKRETIRGYRIDSAERSIERLFTGAVEISESTVFEDIRQISGNNIDDTLFWLGDKDRDVMTDIDKDNKVLPIATVNAAWSANLTPVDPGNTFFQYIEYYLREYQNQPYNFYFTIFMCDRRKARNSPPKQTYSVNLPPTFLANNFLPAQEMKIRAGLIESFPFDPDIQFDLSGANFTFSVNAIDITAAALPDITHHKVCVYTFLPQQDIVLTNGMCPFSLKAFKNLRYDEKRCNKVFPVKGRRFNYTFNIFLNWLWMQVELNEYLPYKHDIQTYRDSQISYLLNVLKPTLFYLGSDIDYTPEFETLRLDQIELIPDGLVIEDPTGRIISNIEKNALIDEYLTANFKRPDDILNIKLRLKNPVPGADPDYVLICTLTKK